MQIRRCVFEPHVQQPRVHAASHTYVVVSAPLSRCCTAITIQQPIANAVLQSSAALATDSENTVYLQEITLIHFQSRLKVAVHQNDVPLEAIWGTGSYCHMPGVL